jgi:hypothetical protein
MRVPVRRAGAAVCALGFAVVGGAITAPPVAQAATAFDAVGALSCSVSSAKVKFSPPMTNAYATSRIRVVAKLVCSGTTGRSGVTVVGGTLKADYFGGTDCDAWFSGDHLPGFVGTVKWKAVGGRINRSTVYFGGGAVTPVIGGVSGSLQPMVATYPSLVDTSIVTVGSYLGKTVQLRMQTSENRYALLCGTVRGQRKFAVSSGALSIPSPASQATGNLWAWSSTLGNLNAFGPRRSPLPVGTVTNWSQVGEDGYYELGLRSDGTMWEWTPNGPGPSLLQQVGVATNWSAVAVGAGHYSAALRSDGTLWTWGSNGLGQLGHGDLLARTGPTQVGSDTDWTTISAGHSSMAAIKSDGTLWTWGANGPGHLGLGDHTSRLVPTQVGSDTDWAEVALGGFHALARKTDGSLWAWGNNGFGGLGNGSTIEQLTPIQIGAATNWVEVAVGPGNSVARRSDGSLWTWGRNHFGQLGVGDRANRLVPTRVGTASNWTGISASPGDIFGQPHVLGLRADGSLWAWGNNQYGQLGLGYWGGDRVVPTRVGTRTGWTAVFTGVWGSAALR